MNITLKNIDPVNATITITVEQEDYQAQVKKSLNNIRKEVQLDGFRKGNVPMARIQALYGKTTLIEELNKLVSEKLSQYIKENQLKVLGEPLPAVDKEKPIDFGKQDNYEFIFDVAFSPEINAQLTKNDKLPYYQVVITDEMIDMQIENIKERYGSFKDADVIEENDVVKGILSELNTDGTVKENGLTKEDAVLTPFYFNNQEEQKKFINKKTGDVVIFNPTKAYETSQKDHEIELASFLGIKKEEIKNYPNDFLFTITKINRYKNAEINQELFDKLYEQGTITSEEKLREKIKEELTIQYLPQSEYKFLYDIKQLFLEKSKDIQFPDAIFKRWLLVSNPESTEELIEKEYSKILENVKFQLIKDKAFNDNQLKIEEGKIEDYAYRIAKKQLIQYGIGTFSDEIITDYAKKILSKKESIQNLLFKVQEDKLISLWKEQITLEQKEINIDEFQKIIKETEMQTI
jgi:trigger factor